MTTAITNSLFGSDPTANKASGTSALGKDDFLKLLLAQMQNQDPTAPSDSQAFVAQLAQFSQVEQLQSANGSLSSLLVAQAGASQTAAASLVGKDIVYRSDHLNLTAGQPATSSAKLGADAASVTATITDASGRKVRTIQLGAHAAGQLDLSWDGKDDGGNVMPPGSYTVKLAASDAAGKPVTADLRASGRVTGVAFDDNGVPLLLVGTARIPMGQVAEIDQPKI